MTDPAGPRLAFLHIIDLNLILWVPPSYRKNQVKTSPLASKLGLLKSPKVKVRQVKSHPKSASVNGSQNWSISVTFRVNMAVEIRYLTVNEGQGQSQPVVQNHTRSLIQVDISLLPSVCSRQKSKVS